MAHKIGTLVEEASMAMPTQRSLEYLRKAGYIAAVTENWLRFPDREDDRKARATGWLVQILAVDETRTPTFDPALVTALAADLQQKQIAVKRDLWNFADIIAVRPSDGCVTLVQTTTRANQAARFHKIVEECPEARVWLDSGQKIVVHGWAQVGARGKRKTWQVTETPVTLADVEKSIVERSQQDQLFQYQPSQ